MKIITRTAIAIALLAAGFASGFPMGQSVGFATGSEWALVQADIFAREAGVFMPVRYEEGAFRVMLRQPGDIYNRAWQLADMHHEAESGCSDGPGDRAFPIRTAQIMP